MNINENVQMLEAVHTHTHTHTHTRIFNLINEMKVDRDATFVCDVSFNRLLLSMFRIHIE